MSDTKETTRPMTAEEYWTKENGDIILFDIIAKQIAFAESYASYRLQFEREQQNSWMPTEEEWKRFPEAKCAAMDSDGEVWLYRSNPTPKDYSYWVGDDWFEHIKNVDPTNLNWRQCKVARPEGV